jgi:hypothetical protein
MLMLSPDENTHPATPRSPSHPHTHLSHPPLTFHPPQPGLAPLQEREAFLTEIAAERKRLAEETAAAGRGAEEARAHLLELKARVVEAEAGAAAALQQVGEAEEGGREGGSYSLGALT